MTTPGRRLSDQLAHGLQRMTGRDRREHGRVSTPLELLYDLTVVVAIALSGSQLAAALTTGHVFTGIAAFCFVMFAILWAWISYSWFASAFDTDDWFVRLATLVQMIGVLVIGVGVVDVFTGLQTGELSNGIVVGGYVVMRLGLVALWVRVAKESIEYRPIARAYLKVIVSAQLGWVALAVLTSLLHPPLASVLPVFGLLYALELGGAYWCENKVPRGAGPSGGALAQDPTTAAPTTLAPAGPAIEADRRSIGSPWHPHHIAERYSLLVIITLGEVILGTTTAIDALTTAQGWSGQAILVAVAGVSLAVGIWWIYFGLPMGEILAARPDRGFRFGWGHLPLYAAIAAVGAGLHGAASFVEGETGLDETGTILALAIPVGLVIAMVYLVVHLLMPMYDRFHLLLLSLTLVVLVVAVLMAAADVAIGWCLLVVMLAPWVSVVGYETIGHRHMAAALDALDALDGRVRSPN